MFRPKHLISRDDASIPDISVPAMISTTIRTYLVRILPPLLQNHPLSLEKRRLRGDSGDSQDDSPGTKAAHKTTQHLQAWTCMDRQESQSNWPEMRKTLGKPGVCSMGFRKLAERTGFEPAVGFDPYADLANRCFRPLSHLSGYHSQPPKSPEIPCGTRESEWP